MDSGDGNKDRESLSRRGFVGACGATAALVGARFAAAEPPQRPPTIPGAVPESHLPKFKLPDGACDSHAHVFGPQNRFPYIPNAAYIPPDQTVDDYVRVLKRLGCRRAVLVQPSVYGTNHAAMIEAMGSGKFPFRGVAVVSPDVTEREIEELHTAGFRGIRINGISKNAGPPLDAAPKLARLIKPYGWHLQFFLSLEKLTDAEERLGSLPVNVVIDHFGTIDCAAGLNGPGFGRLLKLLSRDNVWAKLSGPYHISKKPPLAPDVAPFAHKMLDVAPDRLVWATDWPHPTAAWIPDDGDLVDMLPSWVPDQALRTRVLVDNPARLYGFK